MTKEEMLAKIAEATKEGNTIVLLEDGSHIFTTEARPDFKYNKVSQRGNLIYYCYGRLTTNKGEKYNYTINGLPIPLRYWELMQPGKTYKVLVRDAYVNFVQL